MDNEVDNENKSLKIALRHCHHPGQGKFKKVLCIDTANLFRGPTAALVLSGPPYNYNTRSAGLEPYSIIPLTSVLIEWADEIVIVGDSDDEKKLHSHPYFKLNPKPVRVLNIADGLGYRNPALIKKIEERVKLKSEKTSLFSIDHKTVQRTLGLLCIVGLLCILALLYSRESNFSNLSRGINFSNLANKESTHGKKKAEALPDTIEKEETDK